MEGEGAEQQLSRVIAKDDFARMRVLGQFNNGFIIAGLRGNPDRPVAPSVSGLASASSPRLSPPLADDLFIVDQHATDEKAKYEALRASLQLEQQPLLVPLPLDLTPAQRATVSEHIAVFRANGLDVAEVAVPRRRAAGELGDGEKEEKRAFGADGLDDDVDSTVDVDNGVETRLVLRSLPYSKAVQFGAADVLQLCTLLERDPHGAHRLPKVEAMLASRACRSAVMIGMPLSHAKMTAILHHMQGMTHPWACPHGRPTMRHLVDMNMVRATVVTLAAEHAEGGAAGPS